MLKKFNIWDLPPLIAGTLIFIDGKSQFFSSFK